MRRSTTISNKAIFIIAFALPTIYHAAWYFIKFMGWHWHNSWNIPGFLFLAGSAPWSEPFMTYKALIAFRGFLGENLRNLLNVFVISIGFAGNVTLFKLITVWLITKVRRSA